MPDDPKPDRAAEARDENLTWAGNRPLTNRWWWSSAVLIVAGLAVAGYQSGPIRDGESIALNWVMVAVGAGVAIAGLVSLRRAHAAHRATPPSEGTTAD